MASRVRVGGDAERASRIPTERATAPWGRRWSGCSARPLVRSCAPSRACPASADLVLADARGGVRRARRLERRYDLGAALDRGGAARAGDAARRRRGGRGETAPRGAPRPPPPGPL